MSTSDVIDFAAPDPTPTLASDGTASIANEWPDGVRIALGSNTPVVLGRGDVWVVAVGAVDVFTARRQSDDTIGRRTHLVRVAAGGALFGALPVDEWRFLAVGTSGTQVIRVPAASFHAAGSPTLTAMVEPWIHALQTGVARGLVPQCRELDAAADESLDANENIRARDGVLWIRHRHGHSHFLGRQGLVVNGAGLTPLSNRAWVRSDGPSHIELLSTLAVTSTTGLLDGLERMHELVLRCAALLADETASLERDRLLRKVTVKRRALADACGRLLSVVQSGRRRTPHAAPETAPAPGQALLSACRLAAKELGFEVVEPTASEAGASASSIAAIARASRVRERTVLLRDDWWNHEHGPLVAFRASDDAPCALIPHARGGYVLHDPVAGTAIPVTEAESESLKPLAHSFYRVFPDRPLTAMDVIRFGIRGCTSDLRMVAIVAALSSVLAQMSPIATGLVFNTVVPSANRGLLLQVTVVLITCALTSSMLSIVRSIAMLRIETRMGTAVQAAVWDRLLSLPVTFFRPYAAGDLAVRAMGIDNIRQLISGTTITALFGGFSAVFSVGLMFWFSPGLALRGAGLILLSVGIAVVSAVVQLTSQRQVSGLGAKTSGLVLQLLTAVSKLRVAGAESHAFAAWARRFSEQRTAQYRIRATSNWMQTYNAVFPVLALMILFWSAAGLLDGGGGLRTGDFLAFLAAFTTASGALLGTSMALLGTLNVLPLYELSRPILQARPEVDTAKADPGVLKGQIELQRISFRYSADGPPALRDVTLRIEAGQFIAFVGPSGSGKSTLLRILLGFETAETGVVYYDGQDLAGLDVHAVRRQIGVVLQNGRLRSGDIYTNIVGSSPMGIEQAWDAARMAGFDDDIHAMPMGMHTVVSEGGGTLSGGQRQRLLIARALVHRPRLLYFDEATSALDNRTQAIVSQSLERLQATRVVVAHRLSTIMHADKIIVVERGRIVQSGTFDELMTQGGTFAELARRQLV